MAQTKKRRINRKKQIKRLSLLALIIVLIIFLFVSNFNRMRLWIKGYGFSEQNILLRLDKSWLNEYLELEEDQRRLSNSEQLTQLSQSALQLLSENETVSIDSMLYRAPQ